jgi:AraC family transcriptional regulator
LTYQTAELPGNIRVISAAQDAWSGMKVDVTEFQCAGDEAIHLLHHSGEARLSVVLEEVGGRCEPRLRPDQPSAIAYMPRHMHFARAGMEIWGHTTSARYVRDATLRFDLEALAGILQTDIIRDPVVEPGARFADERLWTLVRMLSDAVGDPDPSARLYGDGLAIAIAARLFALSNKPSSEERGGLAPWRLRRVIEYLEAHIPERIDLPALASLSGLSSAHFSRAFKVSTGLSPYQWQLDARIRRAQVQLIDTDASLDQVAEATGFADAVHFGRTFRKITGMAPAAWRRERKN